MAESSRLEELRRRVQRDPASLIFAQLAEEHRRAGDHQEAVRVCRAGLRHHPGYHSARVTLGRALLELGQLADAERELDVVLRAAPENIAAQRGLGEVYRRDGRLPQALARFRSALSLAPRDTDLAAVVADIERSLPAIVETSPALPTEPVAAGGEPQSDVADTPIFRTPKGERLMTALERWRSHLEADRHRRDPAAGK